MFKNENLMKAKNVFWENSGVTREMRQKRTGCRSFVIWLTGLSGSGKTTIARALQEQLFLEGYPVYLLDGDNVRHGLSRDLGFGPEDRREHIRRVGEVAKLFVDAGMITVASFISPYKKSRDFVRKLFRPGEFVEVYVKTDMAVCEKRDKKGLYQKARAGMIPNFTGVNSEYEAPENAEVVVNTEQDSIEACLGKILEYCLQQELLAKRKNQTIL